MRSSPRRGRSRRREPARHLLRADRDRTAPPPGCSGSLMGPWRLELLRVWRTRRMIALAATFLILGLGVPVLTYYLPELVKNAGNGVRIIAPKPTPADAITGFASNVAQLGTLVIVVVAAASLSIDAHPGLAAFYRTRVHRPILLVLPRYVVVTAASVATLALGTLGAWYETRVLLGSVPFGHSWAGSRSKHSGSASSRASSQS